MISVSESNLLVIVFEDKELADQAVIAVEKEIHHDVDIDGTSKHGAVHAEDATQERSPIEKV